MSDFIYFLDESNSMKPVSSPVSSQSSRRDSSSSTSTELCDDPQLSDSEDKASSLHECSVISDSICGTHLVFMIVR